ncbi:MAG: phage holin family protein [bacterium]
MKLLINWLAASLVIFAASYILPGITVENFSIALVTAVALGLINMVLRPILLLLTLPINVLTLGLFTFVINAALIMLTGYLVPGFIVSNFWWALLLSLILSVVNLAIRQERRQVD